MSWINGLYKQFSSPPSNVEDDGAITGVLKHQRQNLHRSLRPQAPAGKTRASHRHHPQSTSLVLQTWLAHVAHQFLFCRIWNSRAQKLLKYLAIARARRHPAAKTILPSESAVTTSTGHQHPKPRFQRYHERRIHCIRPTRLGTVKLNVNTYALSIQLVCKEPPHHSIRTPTGFVACVFSRDPLTGMGALFQDKAPQHECAHSKPPSAPSAAPAAMPYDAGNMLLVHIQGGNSWIPSGSSRANPGPGARWEGKQRISRSKRYDRGTDASCASRCMVLPAIT